MSLNLELDTSLRIAHSLSLRGHHIYHCDTSRLAWTNSSKFAHTVANPVLFKGGPTLVELLKPAPNTLSFFDGIHMRKDPPFDIGYVASTWFLDAVSSQTKVLNRPEMLRNFNEKLGSFQFSEWMLPSCVSAHFEELIEFVKEIQTEFIIIKPLDLFGGRGVQKLENKNHDELKKIFNSLTENGHIPIMVQPFDSQVEKGEIRAFTAGGETINWCKKIPAKGEFLANTRAGATLAPHEPTTQQQKAVTQIAQKLFSMGVFLTGIDLIGDHVSEINITSPRLLLAPEDPTNYYDKIAILVEDYCKK